MKLKVTKRYVDKYTKVIVEKDTVLPDVKEARAKELLEAGVVQKVKEDAKEASGKTKKE